MRRIARYALFLATIITLYSCQTNEQKANKLIRTHMQNSLYDYASYKPMQTRIDTLRAAEMFRDLMPQVEIYVETQSKIKAIDNKIEDANRNVRRAKSNMEWKKSMLQYGFSSYYKAEYENAKEEYKSAREKLEELKTERVENEQKIDDVKATIIEIFSKSNEYEDYGWLIDHSFKCNTMGGFPSVGHEIFLVDKEFRTIYYNNDAEDATLPKTLEEIIQDLHLSF